MGATWRVESGGELAGSREATQWRFSLRLQPQPKLRNGRRGRRRVRRREWVGSGDWGKLGDASRLSRRCEVAR